MACGTGFYLAATMIIILGIAYMGILYKIKFSQDDKIFLIMKVFLKKDSSETVVKDFEKKCGDYFSNLHSLNLYSSAELEFDQLVYSVKLKKPAGTQSLVNNLSKSKGIDHIELINQDSALYI